MEVRKIILTGDDLCVEDLILIALGYYENGRHCHPIVEASEEAKSLVKEFRAGLEAYMEDHTVYGVNTGCGIKKATMIPNESTKEYQKFYIPAHCVGIGESFSEEVVRMVLVLRVNSFLKGNSGVTLELCEKLLEIYNKGVIPVVPEQGSVGSSGDLCCLAHIGAVITGIPEQTAMYNGEKLSSVEALARAGIEPIELQAKEAMGLTNGSTFTLALLVLGLYDSENLLKYSNLAAGLSLEAIRGEKAAFDPRVHEARRLEYEILVAEEMRRIFFGSIRMTDEAREICLPAEVNSKKYYKDRQGNKKAVPRVQDAYSFRAYAQVAGSVWSAIEYVRKVVEAEINASTDNPLVFLKEDGHYETVSGGNFHGEPLAQAADFLKIAMQQLANISDRRFYALTMSSTSYGLPSDLAGQTNVDENTGFMIAQYSTAGLVSENKALCWPQVVDSIPTSANQEDYVSMGTIAARHLSRVLNNSYAVIALEMLAACQGISLTEKDLGEFSQLGEITGKTYTEIRKLISVVDDDRYLHADFVKMIEFLKGGELLKLYGD